MINYNKEYYIRRANKMKHVSILQIQLYNKQVFWVGKPFVVLLVSQCREEEAPPLIYTHLTLRGYS